MAKRVDITGQKFGMLTAIEIVAARSGRDKTKWLCSCECGGTTLVKTGHLRSGGTSSCGCMPNGTTTHGLSKTAEYKVWLGIRARCYRKSCKSYADYGGRGISMSKGWEESFPAFYSDMGSRPPNHEIDRIDNDGDYSATNCRWVTRLANARNKRNNVLHTENGETLCISEWAEKLGWAYSKAIGRIKKGIPLDRPHNYKPKKHQRIKR